MGDAVGMRIVSHGILGALVGLMAPVAIATLIVPSWGAVLPFLAPFLLPIGAAFGVVVGILSGVITTLNERIRDLEGTTRVVGSPDSEGYVEVRPVWNKLGSRI